MSPHKPEDWPGLFEQHLNAGDLDAGVALYEPGASFVPHSGDTIVGRDGIRQMLAGLIRTKTRWQGRVIKAVTVGDVAVVYTDFQGTTDGPPAAFASGGAQGDHGDSAQAGADRLPPGALWAGLRQGE